MKFLFRHLLLLGVILGLAGQSVAFASSPCAEMQKEQMTTMAASMAGQMVGMADCAMSQHKSDKNSAPCKDMTPGCLAMAGCAAIVGLGTLSPNIEPPLAVAGLELWSATSVLTGRSVAPEPDPPSLLG